MWISKSKNQVSKSINHVSKLIKFVNQSIKYISKIINSIPPPPHLNFVWFPEKLYKLNFKLRTLVLTLRKMFTSLVLPFSFLHYASHRLFLLYTFPWFCIVLQMKSMTKSRAIALTLLLLLKWFFVQGTGWGK